MLRWFPRFQVATTCFSCSPPNLNLVVTNFMFSLHVKYPLPLCNNPIAVNKYYYYYYYKFVSLIYTTVAQMFPMVRTSGEQFHVKLLLKCSVLFWVVLTNIFATVLPHWMYPYFEAVVWLVWSNDPFSDYLFCLILLETTANEYSIDWVTTKIMNVNEDIVYFYWFG